MSDYQLYIRDGYGELLGSALQVRASSDADAIAEAATLRKHVDCALSEVTGFYCLVSSERMPCHRSIPLAFLLE
jgi:hypothetical protein